MGRTTLDHLILNLTVNTSHCQDLEFVLSDTSNRTGRNYEDELYACVEKQLKDTKSTVLQYGAYGHVWLEVQVYSVEEIPLTTELVNKCIDQWVNRFKVEKMKRND